MKIRLIAAVLTFATAICSGILCTVYTDRLCSKMSSDITQAANDYDYTALSDIKHHWDKNAAVLSAFVPHEQIDEVTEILSRAMAFLSNNDRTEFDAEISSIQHHLHIIGTYDAPTIRALF